MVVAPPVLTQVASLRVARGYGLKAFKAELRDVVRQAGIAGVRTCLLLEAP